MTIVRTLLRVYSYLFQAAFVVACLAMAALMLVSGPQTVNYLFPAKLWTLDWTLTMKVSVLVGLAVVGVLILLLAVRGKLRMVYIAWSALVLALVVRLFFMSPLGYTPTSGGFTAVISKFGGFTSAVCLILAALVAVLGASVKPTAKAS